MYNVWVATDWHCWSKDNRDLRHPYRSVSNLGRLADNYAEEIQVDDLFIHLGDLCDPAVTDPKQLARIVSSIPCRKILCKGNHDVQSDEFYLQVGFDEVCDICKIGNLIFSHKPVRVAPDEINIHGHLHTAKLSTLGSNHINAFRSNFDTHPVLVEDLLEKAPYQDPEDWTGTELYGVEKNFEQYMSVENDCYSKILDLTEEFDDYPLDEAAGPDNILTRIVEFNQYLRKNFNYGLRINGIWDPRRNTTAADWDKYLVIQSPEEFEQSKVGVCWDYVSYEAWYFRKYFPEVKFKTYYIQFFDNADEPTHTILTFNLAGKAYYFEVSYRRHAGVYSASSIDDIINYVIKNMSDESNGLLDRCGYDAWDYDALDTELYGMHCQEYMTYVMDHGKCLHHTWHKHRHPVTRIDTSSLTESIASVLDEVLFEDPGDTEYWEQDDDYKPSAKIKEPMADGESGIVSESLNPDQIIRQIRPYLQEGLTFPVIIPPEYTGVVINSHVANMLPQILPMLGVAWLTKLVLLAVTTASIIESQLFAIDVIARKSDNSENVIFNGPGHIRNMEVCAVADGTIHAITSGHSEDDSAVAKLTQIFGNCIVIKHSLCMYSIYAHLASVKYKVGAKVRAGQVIGTVGSTGNSSEPHLHFQVCVTDPSVAVLTGTLHQLTPLPNIFLNSVPVRFRGISYAILPGTTASIQASTRDATWSYADASNPIGMSDPMKIYLVRVGAINESVLRSSVDKDHEQKGRLRLSQFAQYALTKERRKKYQPEFPNLRHFYDHGEKSHDSVIWVDNNDHPVAAVSVYYEKDDPHAVRDQWSGHNWIAELEIAKDYRGYGLAKQVLHYAVRMLKADALGVADDNKLAQKVYLDYGFKMSNDTSGHNHMMYLAEGATYRDVKAIVATIPKEEHQLFYNVERNRGFVDSPYVEYRDVAYHNIRGTKHGVFIDVYVDPEDASIGNIVIAAAPLARGTGIADKLVKKMLKHITYTGITTLHWTVSKDNTPSIKLAERNGFYRGSDTEDGKCLYVYDIESRNAPTRFQVKEEPTTNPNDPVSSKGVKLSFYLQGEQIGEASISAVDTTTGFLYDVEVFPKFRGKGYGTEIMRYIMTNHNVTEVTVEQSNTRAIKLYKKFGFTIRKKFKENGKPMYDMQYGAGISESARPDVLYHGSITKYDVLKPSIAQAYPDKARVFATPDYGFALAFAGKPWNDLEINQCTVNGRQILTEILPGKFEEKFNCSGYVHHVSSEGFYNIGSRLEQVCDMDVPVQRVDRIQNVRQALINHGVMLYAYPSLPPHIRSRVKYLKDLCTKYHINYDDIAQEYSITESYYTPPVLTEDSDFHEMDPKAKRSLMDKHGLKTPGQEHEYSTDPDADEETDPEKRLRERKEKRLKNLKKARKIKKRKAFVRKLKSHLPGVKNEEVETDPFNGDQERFFEPPDHYAEYVRFNESFHFEMLDDVKFLDPISETSDADKRLCPVYVLLIRGNSPVSALISGFTQSMYTHVSISFDPTLTKMYSFAAKDKVNTLEALIGGFKTENIQAKFFKENKIPYAVYVVPSTQDEIKRMKKRLEYFIRNETKFRFDYGGLVKNYFKIEDYPENRWFCSRFVGEILNAGRPDRPYVNSPALLRPEDFRTISFARFVESGMDAAKYNASRVEKKTKAILREESLKYLSKMPAAVNESIIYDVDPLDLLSESVVECLIAQLDESAFQDFLIYLQSFKVKFDKDGNVIISRREIDQLDQRFRQTVREARAYQAAGNIEGMKECLAQTYFMIELINRHYLNPKAMQSNRVKADLKKEMTDLRSVMLNMFQRNLKWVTAREPQFNFQEYYDGSKYGKNMYIPKEVVTALGTTLVTALR